MNVELSLAASEETNSSDQTCSVGPALGHERTRPEPARFRKVQDSRGHPIRGLWQRNTRFYAQLRVPGKKSVTKVCLLDSSGAPARTPVEARIALHNLLQKRREHSLPALRRSPTLPEYAARYIQRTQGTKSPLTIAKEAGALANWKAKFGFMPLV